jgi:hypothetical protein
VGIIILEAEFPTGVVGIYVVGINFTTDIIPTMFVVKYLPANKIPTFTPTRSFCMTSA